MSKISFLKAGYLYPELIDQAYVSNPELAGKPYNQQLQYFMELRNVWSDYWKKYLENTGEYVVQEVIANIKPLQVQWAKEHNVKYSEENWILEILEAQLAHYKVELFFDNCIQFVSPTFKKEIKNKYRHIKLIITWDGVNVGLKYLKNSDIVLTCISGFRDYFRKNGIDSHLLPHGFEASLLNELKLNRKKYKVSFAGGVQLYRNGHLNRLSFLTKVNKQVPMDLFISGMKVNLLKRHQIRQVLTGNFSVFKNAWELNKNNNGGVFGMEMFQVFADSLITVNSHIDASGRHAGNIRLFEATGTGTCLVTDWKEDLSDYFDIDNEVVTYKSPEECVEKIKWLLNNDKKRQEIAKAGQKRTLKDHSHEKRIGKDFIEIIKPYLD